MKLVDASLRNPTAVAVVCLLVVLFGALALLRIPIQMTPTVERPRVSVSTRYPGAAPQEVEEQITIPMEEELNAVENLRELTSTSSEGESDIDLEFDWGVDGDSAVADIRDRISQVQDLPDEADPPQIRSIASRSADPIMWFNARADFPINELREIADDIITPRIRRVEGVGDVRQSGGQEREIQVVVDLEALRARNLTLTEIRQALLQENRNVRGGDLDSGGTRYLVRTVGQFRSIDDIRNLIISRAGQGEVLLGDVAQVIDGHTDTDSFVRLNGEPGINFGVIKKTGANTIQVVNGVRQALAELRETLGPRGLRLTVIHDQSGYIWASIRMVRESLMIGALLAIAVLLLFLRSPSSMLIIAVDIPICLIGSVICLWATGRTLNIVSLAGLAFSVGIVVDNSIVVLESIFRRREQGDDPVTAARAGASRVGMAVVASTLTNVAVFLPIVLIREEAGQLFADLALAITFATLTSLFMALYVTPVACAKFLHLPHHPRAVARRTLAAGIWHGVHVVADKVNLGFVGRGFAALYRGFLRLALTSLTVRVALIAVLAGLAALALFIRPPMEYLPTGNRNFFATNLRLPPGITVEEMSRRIGQIEERFRSVPEVESVFAVGGTGRRFIGVVARPEHSDAASLQRLQGTLNRLAQGVPGIQSARVNQSSLFQRGRGSSSRQITVDITGPDLNSLIEISRTVETAAASVPGVSGVDLSYQEGNRELQVEVDRVLAGRLGLSLSDVATVVQTAVGGIETGVFRVGGKEYDIRVRSDRSLIENPDALRQVLLTQRSGATLPLSGVARVIEATGPTEIEHIEMERAISATVHVSPEMPIESVITGIEERVAQPLRDRLPPQYQITLSGSADDLARTVAALSGSLWLAAAITYLLMAAIFESFWYPLLIMLTVPFAATGGFLALGLMQSSTDFNVVTMFGFVVLIGCVVNNAILIVAQTLDHMRMDRMEPREAIVAACQSRLRPIFMSTSTSILGMLPLAIGTGAGSELYRGLAIVVVGGLAFTALVTLALIPTAFLAFHRLRSFVAGEERVHHFDVAPEK